MANGLVDLQTDLKSLRYGSMPLGSDKPYVTKDINNPPSSNLTSMEITKRIDDTSRIAQMLIDRPGLKYLFHEAELKQIGAADKIAKARKNGKSVAGAILGQLGNTAIGVFKIAASTLAQVPVNGTGTHFVKEFRTDTYLQPIGGNNRSAFAQFFGAGGVEGAPLAIEGSPIEGVVQDQNFYYQDALGIGYTAKTSDLGYSADITKGKVYKDGVNNTPIPPDSAVGGPASNAQQGRSITVGNRALGPIAPLTQPDQTTVQPGSLSSTAISAATGSGTEATAPTFDNLYSSGSTYTAKKVKTAVVSGSSALPKNVTKESRVNLGDQGNAKGDKLVARKNNQYWFKSDVDPMKASEVDKINALDIKNSKVVGEVEGRDLIKFRFHILTPGEEKVLYFRAFLDSFDDSYAGQWNPTKYLGRGEDFQVYGGFQRKISLSFKIAAATRAEMRPLYRKIVYLASATAPTYAGDGQFMRGTITKLTLGDYVGELPGVLNSVNYTWNTEYPWEIAMLDPEKGNADDVMQELPMVLECRIDFTPIHPFTPVTGLRNYITAGTQKNNYFTPTADPLVNVLKQEQVTQKPPAQQPPLPVAPRATGFAEGLGINI